MLLKFGPLCPFFDATVTETANVLYLECKICRLQLTHKYISLNSRGTNLFKK